MQTLANVIAADAYSVLWTHLFAESVLIPMSNLVHTLPNLVINTDAYSVSKKRSSTKSTSILIHVLPKLVVNNLPCLKRSSSDPCVKQLDHCWPSSQRRSTERTEWDPACQMKQVADKWASHECNMGCTCGESRSGHVEDEERQRGESSHHGHETMRELRRWSAMTLARLLLFLTVTDKIRKRTNIPM